MKNVFYCVVSAMAVIMFLLWIELLSRYSDLKQNAEFDKAVLIQRIELLEKEVRILKQDNLIIKGCFEDE